MVLIGLTGGIATGKSAVSQMLRERRVPVIDADEIAHRLQEPGTPVWQAIRDAFGWPVLDSHGQLNRHWLGRRVFGDAAARARLNAIVHPAVRDEIWRQVEVLRQQGAPLAVLDVPLLIENGLYRDVDQVWLVYCDPLQEKERLMARNGLTEEAALERMRAQMPIDDKRAYATVILDNRGSLDELERQVERLLSSLGITG